MPVLKDRKQVIENILICIYIFMAGLIMSMQCSMNPLKQSAAAGVDSSVFKTMALSMSKGLVPYKDSFDHKGPLIYIINWLGMQIAYYKGIWIIELLAMLITFGLIYKIARFLCGKVYSCLTLLITAFMLFQYLEGGNLVEEYAMPFIAAAIYIFTDYFLNDKINALRLIICGFSFGAVCLLRINMASVWVVFCIAVLIQTLYKKQADRIGRFLLWFICGMAMIMIPILVWFMANHALYDFWNDYIVYNSLYVSEASFYRKRAAFFYFLISTPMVISLVSLIYCYRTKKDIYHCAYICYYFLTLFWISMAGREYPHYGMILIPLMAYPIGNVFMYVEMTIKRSAMLQVIVWIVSISVWWEGIVNITESWEQRNNDAGRTYDSIIEMIMERTAEDDRITVWGNWNIIYVLSHRVPAVKYSYQFPIAEVNDDIYTEYYEELESKLPKLIIIQPDAPKERMEEFLNDHIEYYYLGEIDGADIYEYSGE